MPVTQQHTNAEYGKTTNIFDKDTIPEMMNHHPGERYQRQKTGMTFKTSNTGIHLTALQTRTDLISGSGYHHDLSRDGSDDDDLKDA